MHINISVENWSYIYQNIHILHMICMLSGRMLVLNSKIKHLNTEKQNIILSGLILYIICDL